MGANKNFRRNTPQKVVVVVEGVQDKTPRTILSFQQEQQNFIPPDRSAT